MREGDQEEGRGFHVRIQPYSFIVSGHSVTGNDNPQLSMPSCQQVILVNIALEVDWMIVILLNQ